MSEGYNGWTNWDTWNANIHLTNDESDYNYVVGESPETIKIYWVDLFDNIDGIDTDLINFQEISEALNE